MNISGNIEIYLRINKYETKLNDDSDNITYQSINGY